MIKKSGYHLKDWTNITKNRIRLQKNLETNYKKVNVKTKSSSNESLINEILSSPRIKLSLSDSILLDGRDKNVAFVDFVYALKKKNVECTDIYYTFLDAIGLNPHKIFNKDAKKRGSWNPFQIRKSQATEVVQGRKSRIWFTSKTLES